MRIYLLNNFGDLLCISSSDSPTYFVCRRVFLKLLYTVPTLNVKSNKKFICPYRQISTQVNVLIIIPMMKCRQIYTNHMQSFVVVAFPESTGEREGKVSGDFHNNRILLLDSKSSCNRIFSHMFRSICIIRNRFEIYSCLFPNIIL